MGLDITSPSPQAYSAAAAHRAPTRRLRHASSIRPEYPQADLADVTETPARVVVATWRVAGLTTEPTAWLQATESGDGATRVVAVESTDYAAWIITAEPSIHVQWVGTVESSVHAARLSTVEPKVHAVRIITTQSRDRASGAAENVADGLEIRWKGDPGASSAGEAAERLGGCRCSLVDVWAYLGDGAGAVACSMESLLESLMGLTILSHLLVHIRPDLDTD